MAISAAAIWASDSGQLVLDPPPIVRDIIFYAASLGLLWFGLSDRRVVDDDGGAYVFVSRLQAGLLFLCYVLYVIVCGNFDTILAKLNIQKKPDAEEHQQDYKAMEEASSLRKVISFNKVPSMPFARAADHLEHVPEDGVMVDRPNASPLVNDGLKSQRKPSFKNMLKRMSSRKNKALEAPLDSIPDDKAVQHTSPEVHELYVNESHSHAEDEAPQYDQSTSEPVEVEKKKKKKLKIKKFILNRIAPKLDGIQEIEKEADGTVHMYLWQRSSFYDMAKVDKNAWLLRYFTFSQGNISSVSVRKGKYPVAEEPLALPKFESFDIDETRLLIRISTQTKDILFKAPSSEHMVATVVALQDHLDLHANEEAKVEEKEVAVAEPHESLIAIPTGMGIFSMVIFAFIFPLKAIIHFTVPDVRSGSTSLGLNAKAQLAVAMCILSLIVGSYAMVRSLEMVGDILNVPPSIIGVTVSAAGTSLPNLVSSTCAARMGLGNMAIANVFGSNTFNILVGLGLPWTLYTLIYGTYHDLPAGRIDESMIVMILALILFIVLVCASRFVLKKWHAWLFSLLYAGYIFVTIYDVIADRFEN